MILYHMAQNATKDATEKNGMNGRIRIIRPASVTAVIRTKSATGQSRMMRSTRIVQNGTSIEDACEAARKGLLRPAPSPLRREHACADAVPGARAPQAQGRHMCEHQHRAETGTDRSLI